MAKTKTIAAEYPTWFDEQARTYDGKVWVRGTGSLPADSVFVGERPTEKEVRSKRVFTGAQGELLFTRLTTMGFQYHANCYWTDAVKYSLDYARTRTHRLLRDAEPAA